MDLNLGAAPSFTPDSSDDANRLFQSRTPAYLWLLGLSIQQGLLDRVVPGQAVGPLASVKWKFKGPIRIGDTIHVEARVSAKKDGDAPASGLVTVERRVLNQRGEIVQEGETEHVIARRPA